MKSTLMIFLIIFALSQLTSAELYSSVDELAGCTMNDVVVSDFMEKRIEKEMETLEKMRELQRLFILVKEIQLSTHNQYGPREWAENPVSAFVIVHKITRTLSDIQTLIDEIYLSNEYNLTSKNQLDSELDDYIRELKLPTRDDLLGCGEGLLRLQSFYNLSFDDIVNNRLDGGRDSTGQLKMDAENSNELAKIAYGLGHHMTAIQWFNKAIDQVETAVREGLAGSSSTSDELINEALEYMAFSGYSLGRLKYAIKITQLWLDRDPQNERAQGNLESYLHELEKKAQVMSSLANLTKTDRLRQDHHSQDSCSKSLSDCIENMYAPGVRFDPLGYDVSKDRLVIELCRKERLSYETIDSRGKKKLRCFKRNKPDMLSDQALELKIEELYDDPYIIRFHDIITEKEADHLRDAALPNLRRSTVQSTSGSTATSFRIAKTAWLVDNSDEIVNRIDRRLAQVTKLNLEDAEDLQVVNYGLGGFYGPHWDSNRDINDSGNVSSAIETSGLSDKNETSSKSGLKDNDRLATILIYLNSIRAGGATVFPKLGLHVEPVERSAVLWYNLKKNGATEEKTLHTGCPILIGSKWIATKWPHERGNIFVRPCGLRPDE